MKRCCSINMFSIQANATKSIATNAALPRLRNHLWSIPSAPPLLRQFTNIWNIPHLKNGLRIIYYLLLSHFSIGIILNVIVLKVPLLMPVWWVCALQLLKRKPQENPRSYLAFQEGAKGPNPFVLNMLLKNGSMGSSLGEVEKLSQELADVEIHCKDGILHWNRSLLATWSPLLRLQCNWQ